MNEKNEMNYVSRATFAIIRRHYSKLSKMNANMIPSLCFAAGIGFVFSFAERLATFVFAFVSLIVGCATAQSTTLTSRLASNWICIFWIRPPRKPPDKDKQEYLQYRTNWLIVGFASILAVGDRHQLIVGSCATPAITEIIIGSTAYAKTCSTNEQAAILVREGEETSMSKPLPFFYNGTSVYEGDKICLSKVVAFSSVHSSWPFICEGEETSMSKPQSFLWNDISVCEGDEMKQKEGSVCNIGIYYLTAASAIGYLVIICSAKAVSTSGIADTESIVVLCYPPSELIVTLADPETNIASTLIVMSTQRNITSQSGIQGILSRPSAGKKDLYRYWLIVASCPTPTTISKRETSKSKPMSFLQNGTLVCEGDKNNNNRSRLDCKIMANEGAIARTALPASLSASFMAASAAALSSVTAAAATHINWMKAVLASCAIAIAMTIEIYQALTASVVHATSIHSGGKNNFPRQFNEDKRSAVAEVRSMANSMCKNDEASEDVRYRMAAAEESSDQNSNASSLAIRSASILAIKDLSPKLEVSKIFWEFLQVLTVISGNVSLSIVSEGV